MEVPRRRTGGRRNAERQSIFSSPRSMLCVYPVAIIVSMADSSWQEAKLVNHTLR